MRAPKGLDLAMGPSFSGGQFSEAITHSSAPGLSDEYMNAIQAYVEKHKYYPQEAAANGEDGASQVELTIGRDGRVTNVRLLQSAGSRWLDMAWEGLFRDHRFAPFPPGVKEDQVVITYTMNYELLRR
jgi:protein TonB